MATGNLGSVTAEDLVQGLRAAIERAVARAGSSVALKPGHRVRLHWPPHPVSYEYHLSPGNWTGKARFEVEGEGFEVIVARTSHGVFGRCVELWHEDRGDSEQEMLENLTQSSMPLLRRQLAINRALERSGRFTGHIRELGPLDILKLLYCDDRDVAAEAQTEIETHASNGLFLPALVEIVRDQSHPNRRIAQWCALDLFEDLPSFCSKPEDERMAVDAIRDLIWTAEDDYARAVFKAGVVLGGHIPNVDGGETLLECLRAPSKIGRRSAIHGLFHVVEWIPSLRDKVVAALDDAAKVEPEPLLAEFAALMARDIEAGDSDHIPEPVFPDEL